MRLPPDEECRGLNLHVLVAAHLPGEEHEAVQDVVAVPGAGLHEDGTVLPDIVLSHRI